MLLEVRKKWHMCKHSEYSWHYIMSHDLCEQQCNDLNRATERLTKYPEIVHTILIPMSTGEKKELPPLQV